GALRAVAAIDAMHRRALVLRGNDAAAVQEAARPGLGRTAEQAAHSARAAEVAARGGALLGREDLAGRPVRAADAARSGDRARRVGAGRPRVEDAVDRGALGLGQIMARDPRRALDAARPGRRLRAVRRGALGARAAEGPSQAGAERLRRDRAVPIGEAAGA